jgi:protein SCO1/2/putative membrane protein
MSRRLAVLLALALLTPTRALSADAGKFDSLYLPEDGLGAAPDFTLTERSGKPVRRADLQGKVWVAHFFFTECAAGCSTTTDNLAKLHKLLADHPDVVLVSFTVNPAKDTPERLREYAERWGADGQRWLFLTGEQSTMHDLVQRGFKQTAAPATDPKPGFEIVHSFNVILVDRNGTMRGYVDGKDDSEVMRLGRRARLLAMTISLPAVNAVLNGVCAVLLVAGYLAIRRRRVTLHTVCMLSALGVSILFLACYLYYHFVILDGRPTGFRGEGMIRNVYLAILLTHTILAAVVAPMALVTVYLGLRDRLARHVRLARWTLPLWLYVSVTGVVVYWMLYHLYPSV